MIFFDEAGNSGGNLLDGNQPIYLLLSHDYTKKEADDILAPLDLASQAKEFHFKSLKKYEKTRQAVLKCINNKLINGDRVYYYVAHKEFMIVIHIVDQLIELVLDDGGIDIYKGGLNLSTANLIYILGNNVWDKSLFKEMCHRFVEWLRSNDDLKGDTFYDAVRELFKNTRDEKDKLLVGLILLSQQHRDIVKEAHSKYTLDATLSCFISHCNFWAKKYNVPFDVVFDNSKQIAYWQDMIKFLTDKLPSQDVGYGSRKHKYPLLINSMKMVDSLTDRQIQLSDILASSLNYAYTNMVKGTVDSFSKQILSSHLGAVTKNVMWPSTEVTPEQLNMTDESGVNPLDYLSEHLWKEDKT